MGFWGKEKRVKRALNLSVAEAMRPDTKTPDAVRAVKRLAELLDIPITVSQEAESAIDTIGRSSQAAENRIMSARAEIKRLEEDISLAREVIKSHETRIEMLTAEKAKWA